MNLLDLAVEMGLEPRKTSASRGGEYHCPCPVCEGKDRFMFWPEKDRFWCRQCNAQGDRIQFCRDFLGLSFREACVKVQKERLINGSQTKAHLSTNPTPVQVPSRLWYDKARIFTDTAIRRLLIDGKALELISQRGLSLDSIKKHRLGWNPVKTFHRRADWGLDETKERQWICLPDGIVIPVFENNDVLKLKIRKSEWEEGDFYGKYYEVPGSFQTLPIFGNHSSDVAIIMEAELDAMLVVQEAGDLCACIPLGGAQKRPNPALNKWLHARTLLLFALDFDTAGKNEYPFWQGAYPNLEPWPVPEEKSPGDYFKAGGKIRDWVSTGIRIWQKP